MQDLILGIDVEADTAAIAEQVVTSLAGLRMTPVQPTSQIEPELGALANRLAYEVQLRSKHGLSPKVVVMDFANNEGIPTVLGDHFAELLSNALAKSLGPEHIVSHRELRGYLISSGISPFDLQNSEIARWNAEKVGANIVVLGRILSSEKQVTLTVEVLRANDAKELSKGSADVSLPEQSRGLTDKPLDWPASPAGVDYTKNGIKFSNIIPPRCIYCPQPSFTKEAQRARYSGRAIVKVCYDDTGRTASAIVIKGAPYGLDEHIVKSIREWRLEPAMLDGKAVSACTLVEVGFHWEHPPH